MRVEWLPTVPREIRRSVEPMLKRALKHAPAWLEYVTVDYAAGDADTVATCDAQPEYRQATIAINAAWVQETDDSREETLVHEVCHILLAPAVNFTSYLIDKLFNGDAAGKAIIEEQWRIAVESSVQDTALALRRR